MAREGESYLDQLLNNVAPGWEDTSKQPEREDNEEKDVMSENRSEVGNESVDEEVSLEEAMAILNDLPDMDDETAEEGADEPASGMDSEDAGMDAMMDAVLNDLPDMGAEEEESGADSEDTGVDAMMDAEPEPEMDAVFDDLPDIGADEETPGETEAPQDEEVDAMMDAEPEPEMDAESEPEIDAVFDDLPDIGADEETSGETEAPQDEDMDATMDAGLDPEMDAIFNDLPDIEDDGETSGGTEVPQDEDMDAMMELLTEALGDAEEELSNHQEETPLSIDSLPEEPQEEVTVSEDSIDVDDIFQDALSAVGYSENEEEASEGDAFALGDMSGFMDDSEDGVSSVPVAEPFMDASQSEKKEKKPGFFKRIFGNIVTDTTADDEERERQEEQEAKERKAAQKEEKKKQAEVTKEEKAALAQEKKEQKKQQKAEAAAKKEEKKKEKKRLKAERDAEAAKEVVGKINPVGAAIVVIVFATIGIVTVFGSRLLERRSSLNDAENYFANEEYILAYNALSSVNLNEDDETLYRRVRICSQMQKELNSYQNYNQMGMRLEALDSLIKGIRYYETNESEAQTLEIQTAFNKLKNQLTASLSQDFGLGEDETRNLLSIPDREEYTMRLQEITGTN